MELALAQRIDVTPSRAYRAFTQPSEVSIWFTTNAQADLHVGGAYNNGDGDHGIYLALDEPERVSFTWENREHCPGTTVEVRFSPMDDGRTLVELWHRGLESEEHVAGMREGWSWALESFRSYLETGKAIGFEEWKAEQPS